MAGTLRARRVALTRPARTPGPSAVRSLRGFARSTSSLSHVTGPLDPDQVADLLVHADSRGVLARGSGCSYGDAAQNAGGTVVSEAGPGRGGPRVVVDGASSVVHAVAGATFEEVLATVVPAGFILPVLPGTRRLTVGGALAADVHGKNQHGDGTVARWVSSLELVDGTGGRRTLTPDATPDWFRATLGGMGLTGVVTEATLRLLPLHSTRLRVRSERTGDLDETLASLARSPERYSVAWVDASARGAALGRGVVEVGDHLDEPQADEQEGLVYRPRWAPPVPPLPVRPVTSVTARVFNATRFRVAPRRREEVVELTPFFHRLDALDGWNRAVGPRGFVQYQFAVPDGGEPVLGEVLDTLHREDVPCFLATLKRFGPASEALLTFPRPGWSLALDLPRGGAAAASHLGAVLDRLDRRIAEVGGRIYLCKDGRLSRETFETMYGDGLEDWRRVRAELDPAGTMRSDLGRRLGLCR